LHAVDVIARQDGDASALLAEIALGARLQTLLASHVLKAADLREKTLHMGDNREHNQKDYKETNNTIGNTTSHFLLSSLSIFN
jgi:hypothetical protein